MIFLKDEGKSYINLLALGVSYKLEKGSIREGGSIRGRVHSAPTDALQSG